jgi:predicted CopG family antitoxin
MEKKQIQLDKEVYERIAAQKREGESLSDTIDRLTSDYSLVDFAENTSGDAEFHRDLLQRRSEESE